jgi:hypothetical protein
MSHRFAPQRKRFMTATAPVVRLASANVDLPQPHLGASGNVSISGTAPPDHASPRVRLDGQKFPASKPATLSPARSALAQWQLHLTQLTALHEKASRPVARLQGLLKEAQVELAAAEAKQTQSDHLYAAEVAASVRAGDAVVLPPPPASVAIQNTIAQARASCTGFQLALLECHQDQAKAAEGLQHHRARGEDLLLGVLIEEADLRLRAFGEAYEKAVEAEESLQSVWEFIGEKGRDMESRQAGRGLTWLRALERLRNPAPNAKPLRQLDNRRIMQGAGQWGALVERLKTDPAAQFKQGDVV